jgi:hypothetical protein
VHVRALTEGCSCGRLATWAGTIFTYIRTTGAGVPRALHRDVREQVADCNLTLVYTDRIYIYGVTQKGHGHLTLESKEGLQIDDNCTAEVARSRCMPSSKRDGLVKTPLGEAAARCEGFGRQSEAHQTEANAKKQDCQRGSRGCIVGALSGGLRGDSRRSLKAFDWATCRGPERVYCAARLCLTMHVAAGLHGIR